MHWRVVNLDHVAKEEKKMFHGFNTALMWNISKDLYNLINQENTACRFQCEQMSQRAEHSRKWAEWAEPSPLCPLARSYWRFLVCICIFPLGNAKYGSEKKPTGWQWEMMEREIFADILKILSSMKHLISIVSGSQN